MDRGLILQMLSKLPPERLGQLISEVQGSADYVGNPQFDSDKIGLQGRRMQQQDVPEAYRDLPRRMY